ncbi:hypothetical protein LUZ60_004422 [Juncus effusus]|nr:hypothetical protein LUZ60_004422 [Juncus effusus]
MDNLSPSDRGMTSSFSDDPFFLSALMMDFDSFSEQFLSNELDAQKVFANWSQISSPNQNPSLPNSDNNNNNNNLSNPPFIPSPNSDSTYENQNQNQNQNPLQYNSIIPKPLTTISLAEKMLRVLSLFKESSCAGILAQVWVPVKHGDEYVLTTSDQPFLLDQILARYREISRGFTFSAKEGLPGRVFMSGLPEWTSNVAYYKDPEYLRKPFAMSQQVRGSLALPVFDPSEKASCVAVLELVTNREKNHFDAEMDRVCDALETVNLKTTKTRSFQQCLTKNQKSAFGEILDVLRTICHAHMLPLALTWIPIPTSDSKSGNPFPGFLPKTTLHVHSESSYVTDPSMNEFLHSCTEHQLESGQGIVGKALQSNAPFFSSDVREYSIRDYPLAHHARKFGLKAAVAIKLRSNFTGNDDYVLELFLPVNCGGSEEQQVLLNNLSCTMQKVCRSLRTVETCTDSEAGFGGGEMEITKMPFEELGFVRGEEMAVEADNEKGKRNGEKKRNTAEKNISLTVLQKYFSGSLKDAAKSLGVCPTTLKRICRQNGISRWPSRKINKVNRSLKKIQTVINSVQGVEGGAFKYDPASGCLVTGPDPLRNPNSLSNPKLEPEQQEENPQFQFQHSNQFQNSSSTTDDSSSGSASSHPTFRKKPNPNPNFNSTDNVGQFITVKASYKGDTVRFKLLKHSGCDKLFEEIGKRFRLLEGGFQIKYRDDEEEWVNLSNDSDLRECVDVMDSIGSKNVKLLVKEMGGNCGFSSPSSSCLLMES